MKKYMITILCLFLTACGGTKVELDNLPAPQKVSGESVTPPDYYDGTIAVTPPYTEDAPANAISYSELMTLITASGYDMSSYVRKKYLYNTNISSGYEPKIKYSFNNIIFTPMLYSSSNTGITYPGDRFTENQYGYAEQTTGEAQTTQRNYTQTKLVLAGGSMNLKYLDFGYWIGIPQNSTQATQYIPFTVSGGGWASYTPGSTTFTGKAAAVAYNSNVAGSARELGGNATLVTSGSGSNLNLEFDNYYSFNMSFDSKTGGTPTSVIVNGTNTNGGPAFTTCVSGCNAWAGIEYRGQYSAEEAAGVYRYIDGNNKLYGAFGAH